MKSKKNKISVIIFSIILISTAVIAYILKPMKLSSGILFLTYVVLEIFLYRLWMVCTYGFICMDCGNEFNIGLLKRILFFKNNKKCPRCNSNNIIKETFGNYCLNEWVDSEED
ncbi:hypothetical protein QYB59_000072 [Clostridium perfringens]|nr:hypothetical protein [Clostridium perfringens]